MLSLQDLIDRTSPPSPWAEGDNIPWNDPEFSKRMLNEHLSQDHDLASRRTAKIEAQLDRLADDMPSPPAQVLDLACGPGLYLNRLAARGYGGVGIDFSPASIAHARDSSEDLGVEYRLDDLRKAHFGSGFNVALLLYGQINVFRREEALSILSKAAAALTTGGVLILEPQSYEQVKRAGMAAPSWSSHRSGLFSEKPHVLLTESFWDEAVAVGTQRFHVIDAATGSVTQHAMSNEAYTKDELTTLLSAAGLDAVDHRQSLAGDPEDDGLSAVVARKPARTA
ncbi:MAG: class I SAM-dependent methyltransferase [bacterium]|nr:class I SAM-dependent methyltransferase [bacterium]